MTPRPVVNTFSLRLANLDDAADILKWRNDPITRAMSRNAAVVSNADHSRWFVRTLDDPTKLLLVGEVAGARVGMARFDLLAPDRWEVNINLAPTHRGKGWSHAFLAGALEAVAAHGPTEIVAEIKPENLRSRRLFEAHGFRHVGSFGEVDRFVLSCRVEGKDEVR